MSSENEQDCLCHEYDNNWIFKKADINNTMEDDNRGMNCGQATKWSVRILKTMSASNSIS